ncbi:hypothetical protein ABH945_006541 [Paraburkholderia sp. GAS333]|uniref:hypothetical protein n=1 Tax=Paraburkholderia sp. GAS333 TaxID=3156279 RepID=UPI003D21E59C
MNMSDIRRITAVVETITLSNVYTDVTDDKKHAPEAEIAATNRQRQCACFLCAKDGVQYTGGVLQEAYAPEICAKNSQDLKARRRCNVPRYSAVLVE